MTDRPICRHFHPLRAYMHRGIVMLARVMTLIRSLLRLMTPPASSSGPKSTSRKEGDPVSERHINQTGLELIKAFEGFRAEAYRCPAGSSTVGYGHTKTAHMGMIVTEREAEQLLKSDLRDAEMAVFDLVKVQLTDNEHAALVSFVFNLGRGNFERSTLLRKLNAGDRQGAADELPRWNKAGGKVLRGLTRRREAERALFLRSDG